MISVLKPKPDGVGFYYGMYKGFRIDIRRERIGWLRRLWWVLYINGKRDPNGFVTLQAAEDFAQVAIDSATS